MGVPFIVPFFYFTALRCSAVSTLRDPPSSFSLRFLYSRNLKNVHMTVVILYFIQGCIYFAFRFVSECSCSTGKRRLS